MKFKPSSGESDWHHTVIRSKVKLKINQSSEIKKKYGAESNRFPQSLNFEIIKNMKLNH
jgi:hypothetical protein